MKRPVMKLMLGLSLLALLFVDYDPLNLLSVQLVSDAAAIVGMPVSPGSVAGVARRTTRRAVLVTTSAAAASSQQQFATQQPVSQSQQAQAPSGSPPVGTIVSTLPGGCVPSPKGGVQYYDCGGVYYRAAFQGNNLVYVVQQP